MHQLFLLATALLGQSSPEHLGNSPEHLGNLVIVGGGPTIPEITGKALQLAGGKKAHVLIVPQASTRTDAGQRSEEMWRKAGAAHVTVLDFKDKKTALAAVKEATLIWMPGGSQSRLMQILSQNEMVRPIRDRFHHGATIGGTSAGAAVMSMIMLTGETRIDRVVTNTSKDPEGLGLWPEVIVDQHLTPRGRLTRLLSAVVNHPKYLGIGIDESTAVIVHGRSFEVVGKSNVYVIDARKMGKIPTKNGEPGAASNVVLHQLRAGIKFNLDKGILLAESPKERVDRLTRAEANPMKTKP